MTMCHSDIDRLAADLDRLHIGDWLNAYDCTIQRTANGRYEVWHRGQMLTVVNGRHGGRNGLRGDRLAKIQREVAAYVAGRGRRG